MMLSLQTRLILLCFLLMLKALIDFFSFYYVFPTYGYAGLTVDFEIYSAALSWLYYVVLAVIVCLFSKVILYYGIVFLFTFLPISSFYFVSSGDISLLSVVFGANLTVWMLSQVKFSIPVLYRGKLFFKVISLFIVVVFFVLFVYSGAWRAFSFDLSQLYSFREQLTSIYVGLLGYVLPWCFKIILPVLLVVELAKRKYVVATVISFLMLFILFVTFRKEVLVYLLLPWFIWLFGFKQRDRIYYRIVSLVSAFLIVFYCLTFIFVKPVYFSYFVHRVFVVIGQNFQDYVEFFSENRHLWFSQSFLKGFVSDPYGEPIPKIIGYGRWGEDSEAFSNAGLWASGYMQLGILGILMYAIVLGLVISVLSSLETKAKSEALRLGAMTAIISGLLQVVNVDLPSAILTHGLGIAIILVWLISSNNGRRGPERTSFIR